MKTENVAESRQMDIPYRFLAGHETTHFNPLVRPYLHAGTNSIIYSLIPGLHPCRFYTAIISQLWVHDGGLGTRLK